MKYLELIEAVEQAEKEYGFHALDFDCREIVRAIAAANSKNVGLGRAALMTRGTFGSVPTLNSRLKKLLDDGWIEKSGDPNDG